MEDIKSCYLSLLDSVMNNKDFNSPYGSVDPKALFNYVQKSRMLHLTFEKVLKAGILKEDDSFYKIWKEQYTLNKTRDVRQLIAKDEIIEILTENGIRVMPLKGILIKELYPETYFRRMSDLDILIDKNNIEKTEKLLKTIGYSVGLKGDKHFAMSKNPGINVEIHNALFTGEINNLFSGIWDNAKQVTHNCYIMSDEDLVFHTVLHYGNHFLGDGLGTRSVLDYFVLKKNFSYVLNSKSFNERLEQSGYKQFLKQINLIEEAWFEGGSLPPSLIEVEDYILSSGSFGSAKEIATIYAAKLTKTSKKSKAHIVFDLFFPKYKDMCLRFSVLKKAPVLLPIFWIYRIIRAPYYTRNSNGLLKNVSKVDSDSISQILSIAEKFGLLEEYTK